MLSLTATLRGHGGCRQSSKGCKIQSKLRLFATITDNQLSKVDEGVQNPRLFVIVFSFS